MKNKGTTGPNKCIICQVKKKAAIKNARNGLCDVSDGLKCPFENEIKEEIEKKKFTVVSQEFISSNSFKVIGVIKD